MFGVDFDFDDFYDERHEDEEGERTGKQRTTLLHEIEPSEIERGFLADDDKRVVQEDLPERYQTRRVPVREPAYEV